MTRYLASRLGVSVLLLALLSAIIFALEEISPGDPVRAYLGANASTEAVAAERERLGLDDPVLVRFGAFAIGLLTGDLGRSFRTRQPVSADLASYLPATAELVLVAFIIALVLAALFAFSGVLRWPGGGAYRIVLLLGATAPPFLLALAGIILFYGQWDLLPASGRGPDDQGPTGFLLLDTVLHGDPAGFGDAVAHIVLPATVLAIAPAIAIGRIFRASLEGTLGFDYVRTARSKGLDEFAVLRGHVVRNAVGPALSMSGLQLGFMFAGVVVVEQIFSWPGIGNYLAGSIPVSDFPAIAGVTLVLGTIYIFSNLVVDLLQAAADPRITA